MAASLRYEIEHHVTGIRENDLDTRFTVRRNGKVFYIEISPCRFINSPIMTKKYLAYLKVLKSGEEVLDDIYDTDVYEWVMQPFEPFFADLAPNPPVNPTQICVTLQEYFFPTFFVFNLDIVNEELKPHLLPTNKSPYWPSFVQFDDDFLDDLETWTAFYDPAGIILSCTDPEDALFKLPKKVLIDHGQNECFFKPCHGTVQIIEELKAYKKIHKAGLNQDPLLNLCHLYGIVMDDCDFILGLLLTYIDCGDRPLSARVHPEDPDDPPPAIRRRWLSQIECTLSALHNNGIIWGDVKAENILIDRDNNAWIADFGGGYTEGWVAKEEAGTLAGDLAGMAKLRNLLFQSTKHDIQ
ncbi:hypothetical protein QQS21_009074 [Conoideocrella luteorostrata]|uniref:Protein kinase domain-containing protein n=1 Tax=Conoideocrella luteorostrata TaxID=1105319 RepID=A0AAJ0FVE1_9HYPO|nr:hypothetical protein QQS21_009074 [Conoideocrella luteorostrata]